MKTLRTLALTAVLAGAALACPLFASTAFACGYGGAELSPAMIVQAAALAELGRHAGDFQVDAVRLTSDTRAVVDVRRVVGARAGQRTRMIAVRGANGQWTIAATWAVRDRAVSPTAVSDSAVSDVVSRGACCSFSR